MDLPYATSLFHKAQLGQDDKNTSTLQAAAQRGADVVDAFGSIASRTISYPIQALGSIAKSVLQPASLLNTESRSEENEKLARRSRLLQELSDARSWPEYSAACEALDKTEGAEAWKEVDDSDDYDVAALRHRLSRLRSASDRDDVQGMVHLVRCELTRNIGDICNPKLHQQTRTGTKFLIDDYVATVREVLDRVVQACAEGDSRLDKVDVQSELEQTRRSYGRTALLISGGGTLGMCHIGVIKALFEAEALPRIISGSSSGSIVASVLGCTPDEELLPRLDDFCHGDLAVFVGPHEQQSWTARATHFSKTGHLFDLGNLRRVMVDLLGKTTFLEAYNRTRRVLNIAVTTSTSHESQQVLNYATAPNVVIWSAVCASCAVPLGFEPERLIYKMDNEAKSLAPWDPPTRYIDGSVNGDVPTDILSAEFDVNHSIVSQVNPHVTPFLKLSGYRNLPSPYIVATAALAKGEALNILERLKDLRTFERHNDLLTKLSSVLTQRYHGDITVLPEDFITRFWTILRNPTPQSMKHYCREGERATWPLLNMIKTHMDIELMIDDAVRRVSEHVAFSRSVSDLRKLHYRRSRIEARSSGGRIRTHRASRHSRATSGPGSGWEQFQLNGSSVTSRNGKIPGDDTPPSSDSSQDSVFDSSEDEDYLVSLPRKRKRLTQPAAADLFAAIAGLSVQTQPNTPSKERRGFFDPPSQPQSPVASAPPPMALMMTPVTPRSGSPETNYKSPPSGLRSPRRATSISPERSRSVRRKAPQSPTKVVTPALRSKMGTEARNKRDQDAG